MLATSLADHILAALAAPYRIDGRPIRVGASVGTARWPDHGETARTLCEIADAALYAAKAADRGQRLPDQRDKRRFGATPGGEVQAY